MPKCHLSLIRLASQICVRCTNFRWPGDCCTPKGFHITAQGRDAGAHPGKRGPGNSTLKGLNTRVTDVEPLQGSAPASDLTQGALPSVATLGCDIPPLQGAEAASTRSVFWLTAD